jgi:GSCFA family
VTIEYEIRGRRQAADVTWYRGEHCNFNPSQANMRSPGAVEDFILKGWLPEEPLITPETRIAAFGSCFAQNISDYLNQRNYRILTKEDENAYVVRMGEGIVNTYAIRQQFDWAFRGITPQTELWHGWKAESYGYDEDVRRTTRELFDKTEVFVLTLGLSEIWYDEPTGEVFWRAIPADVFDPSRHRFRVATVNENRANIRSIYDTIREFRPDAKIILTLSPIPLVATFRPVSCITANSVSKAILRAAIDEVYREVEADGVLHYWPSYEIVQDAFGPGRFMPDRRHVKQPVLDYIMALFETHYCDGYPLERPVAERRLLALEATGELPSGTVEAARDEDPKALTQWVKKRLAADDRESAELVLSYALELNPGDETRQRLLERVKTAEEVEAQDIRQLSLVERARRFLRREGKLRLLAERTGFGR